MQGAWRALHASERGRRYAPRHTPSEDENRLAVVELFVDARLVGDEGADAAVAGSVVGDFRVAVHGIAVVPIERVVHAVRVEAGFLAVEGVVAGDRRSR